MSLDCPWQSLSSFSGSILCERNSNMPDEHTSAEQQRPEPSPDTLGDILRKERITKRIAVETIAKDLKLNVKYIKALEENKYRELPADPYVRVYLISIAKYLLLDPEMVLEKFYKVRGIDHESYQDESATKLDMTRVESERTYKPLVGVGAAIVILAILSLIAGRMGWISTGAEEAVSPADTTVVPEDSAAVDSLDAEFIGDTGTPISQGSAQDAPETKTILPDTRGDETPSERLVLEIEATTDSVWCQVFFDGESWRNFIHETQSRTFVAYDSLHVNVGKNANVRFVLNGKQLDKPDKSGVARFKIKPDGAIQQWTQSKWDRVFKDRM
ncbi:MAG: hypothetical protein GF398_21630 [Chitinivibrionales bacterium]|nr:hypothetical protein [Chitinivibrionales bacterium]